MRTVNNGTEKASSWSFVNSKEKKICKSSVIDNMNNSKECCSKQTTVWIECEYSGENSHSLPYVQVNGFNYCTSNDWKQNFGTQTYTAGDRIKLEGRIIDTRFRY